MYATEESTPLLWLVSSPTQASMVAFGLGFGSRVIAPLCSPSFALLHAVALSRWFVLALLPPRITKPAKAQEIHVKFTLHK